MRYLEQGIRLLFEDRDLVIIDKPEGLLALLPPLKRKRRLMHCYLNFTAPEKCMSSIASIRKLRE